MGCRISNFNAYFALQLPTVVSQWKNLFCFLWDSMYTYQFFSAAGSAETAFFSSFRYNCPCYGQFLRVKEKGLKSTLINMWGGMYYAFYCSSTGYRGGIMNAHLTLHLRWPVYGQVCDLSFPHFQPSLVPPRKMNDVDGKLELTSAPTVLPLAQAYDREDETT